MYRGQTFRIGACTTLTSTTPTQLQPYQQIFTLDIGTKRSTHTILMCRTTPKRERFLRRSKRSVKIKWIGMQDVLLNHRGHINFTTHSIRSRWIHSRKILFRHRLFLQIKYSSTKLMMPQEFQMATKPKLYLKLMRATFDGRTNIYETRSWNNPAKITLSARSQAHAAVLATAARTVCISSKNLMDLTVIKVSWKD